ncbi:MAG: hypothetical protein AVO38_13975 [delta proteobacterium ML8_D]|jgi:hypothetical protein|nr:MAG: hypothetical protein AVO38_13975 [delta proteobacterium ML8_D]
MKRPIAAGSLLRAQGSKLVDDLLQILNEATNGLTYVSSLTCGLIPAKGYARWTVDVKPATELFAALPTSGKRSYKLPKANSDTTSPETHNLRCRTGIRLLFLVNLAAPSGFSTQLWAIKAIT